MQCSGFVFHERNGKFVVGEGDRKLTTIGLFVSTGSPKTARASVANLRTEFSAQHR
jgi:hypothetical protein